MEHDPWLLTDVEVDGARVDVAIADGMITAVAERGGGRAWPGVRVDGGGGALIPGLHDHHIHLLALAAAMSSVEVGPPAVTSVAGVAAALVSAGEIDGWVRAVGYHESVAGPLDRWVLDSLSGGRCIRLQHRGGAMWVLSSAGCVAVNLKSLDHPGVERSATGDVTGRVFGADAELAERWGGASPDLAAVGRRLAGYGVTACTDATPFDDIASVNLLADAADAGALPQRLTVMGGPALVGVRWPAVDLGPVKLWAADHALPTIDELSRSIRHAHAAGRAAAVHCVTLEGLIVALAAWRDAGPMPGDRIEHGAVIPISLAAELAELGLSVVTQPGFVFARGDQYLADVDPRDRGDLWRCGSLRAAGVSVVASTDAPFGPADPWVAIAAAMDRRTSAGAVLGPGEMVTAADALGLFQAPEPGSPAPARQVAPGHPADLCLFDTGLSTVLRAPRSEHVRLSVVAGVSVTPGP